ncbi:MAG: hypothetical protein FJ030_11735 [Chloroflexi bacterium]|nr:hypothetical protein [Chloroflexota bacterium]
MEIRRTARPFQPEWALFFLAIAVGAGLRFCGLGDLPRGIYHDEAFYGLDAVSVIEGARPIFFPANNGREPLFVYVLSLSIAAFGRTPLGLRFASAVIGTLTIPATYLLGRALFNRRVGLLAMAVCAAAFWPVALSRVSFRAGSLPLFLGLAIALGWIGWRRRNLWLAILGGAAYGLAFNTYTASRATPLALILFGLIAFFHRRENKNDSAFSAAKPVLAFVIAAAVVVAPLAAYAVANPQQVFAREAQVSIFDSESSAIAAALKHTALALGMFGWGGDTIARHNLPGRPVFDLWTFVFFVIGLIVMIMRARDSESHTLAIVWLAATLLPTVFADDTPHFLRAIGMLPALWLAPAIGFDSFLSRFPRAWAFGIVAMLLTASAASTAFDYFARYAQSPITDYYFESAATDLANEIIARPDFAARIDHRLWDNFASLRFLIADPDGADSADHVLLAVWPYEPDEIRDAVAALPPGSQISARRGALARGDLESEPYSLYTLYFAEPAADELVMARFGESVELRGAAVIEESDRIRMRLGWAVSKPVEADYHVFVHVISGGGIVAQSDGEPLGGLYHFSWLKPGDVLNDEYDLPRGESVRVGLYAPDGTPLGEPVILK